MSVNSTSVIKAAERLSGVANKTPVMTSRTLNDLVGKEVFFKCENFQRIGAFKFRGAYNAISQLRQVEREAGIVTHSSGNHAQGVALAAKLLGLKAAIVMPEDSPNIKQEATASYGAKIVHCQAANREKVAGQLAAAQGYTLVHPYDNDHIIAGQGTAALELFQETGELDCLLVPVGGGGLISGSALAAEYASPSCKVIGVEPALADDALRSWREGKIITLPHVPKTIADGLRTRHVGRRNLEIMRRLVADMITVEETEILSALEYIMQRLKIVVEPSAAAAFAPVLSGKLTLSAKRIGILLSGGNIDLSTLNLFSIDNWKP